MLKRIVITIEIHSPEEEHQVVQDILRATTNHKATKVEINETDLTKDDLPSPLDGLSLGVEIKCKFCGRGCANNRSKGLHEVQCTLNPNRKVWDRNSGGGSMPNGEQGASGSVVSIFDHPPNMASANKGMHELGKAIAAMPGVLLQEGSHVSTCCSKRIEDFEGGFAPGGSTFVKNRCTACGQPCFWKKFSLIPKKKQDKHAKKKKTAFTRYDNE